MIDSVSIQFHVYYYLDVEEKIATYIERNVLVVTETVAYFRFSHVF